MALIECPECKRSVSDQASACPGCGHPLTAPPAPTEKRDPRGMKSLWLALVIAALAALAVATNKLIDLGREESDREIQAIAKENEQALALRGLSAEYDILAGGGVKLNDNAFPAKLARINAEFDAQRKKVQAGRQRVKVQSPPR